MRRSAFLITAALFTLGATSALGQDVELLGRHYGTRPPDGYYRTLATHPLAFQFRRGRAAAMRLRMSRSAAQAAPLRILGPREGPVAGTFHIPVVLGLFSDTDTVPPFGPDTIRTEYFGDGPRTVTAFYSEMSGGKVELRGDPVGWIRSNVTQAQATGGQSGLAVNTTAAFIADLLTKVKGVDWGLYDNDGPDGVPNSGDDDGFVDALAVIQPTWGAECGGAGSSDRIWSHKWSLSGGGSGAFTTTTPSANGGYIRIDDYFIQPIYACDHHSLDQIGVFAHESGHAFGLPDLYDTDPNDGTSHQGDGNWDLMATGAWGCDGATPQSPCQMGAWSKAMLGWVDVQPLPSGTDLGTLSLPAVESSYQVYRVDAQDGSGDYFLLENRQRLGFDSRLPGEGLLIWQIDPQWISSHWALNTINAYAHLGVWLRQADGLGDLTKTGGNRGDEGDPFPYVKSGEPENHVFHAGSNPASISHLDTPSGVTVLDIERVAGQVRFHLLTRFTAVSVRTDGDSGAGGLLTINGAPVAGTSGTFTAAPFALDTLEAAGGEQISTGVREPFTGWSDDSTAPRLRQIETPLTDTTFVATYSGRQVHLAVETTGGVNGVTPGTFVSTPPTEDLWFEQGASAQVEAVPTRGFSFVAWSGALQGQPNPASVTISAPMQAGASFELTYAVPAATVQIVGGEVPSFGPLQVENGTAPVFWTVTQGPLPGGLALASSGVFTGAALELGTFPLTVSARDALGLTAEGSVTLQVSEPVLPAEQLASPFFGVGPDLTSWERRFLDGQGNQNGSYDLGDFRAWVLAHPNLPLTGKASATSSAGGSR